MTNGSVVYGVRWSTAGSHELAADRVLPDPDERLVLDRIDNAGNVSVLRLIIPTAPPRPGLPLSLSGAGVMLLVEVPTTDIEPEMLALLRRPAED